MSRASLWTIGSAYTSRSPQSALLSDLLTVRPFRVATTPPSRVSQLLLVPTSNSASPYTIGHSGYWVQFSS